MQDGQTQSEDVTKFRTQIAGFVESGWFTPFITTIIILNAITLGLSTYSHLLLPEINRAIAIFDACVTTIFVLEIGLKLYAYRLKFFSSGWNVFDLCIVAMALLPGAGAMSVYAGGARIACFAAVVCRADVAQDCGGIVPGDTGYWRDFDRACTHGLCCLRHGDHNVWRNES